MGSIILAYKEEFKDYNSSILLKDMIAGLTSAIVALPLILALGASNGADEATGMKTAILACIFISLFGGGRFQLNGATAATVAVLGGVSINYGVEAVFLCGFLSGIIMVIFSLIKVGKILEKIDKRVLLGLNSGIGLLVVSGQLDNLFGLEPISGSVFSVFIQFITKVSQADIMSVIFGVGAIIALYIYPKKLKKIIPAQIVVFIVGAIINMIVYVDIAKISQLPRVLDFTFSGLSFNHVGVLIAPAFNVALILMIKSVSSVLSNANLTKTPCNVNQELMAMGVGNIIMSFFGCIPSGASFSPTQVSIIAGAKTRMSALFHSLSLIIILLIFAPVITYLPVAVLAGILVHAGCTMIKKPSLNNPISLITIIFILFVDVSIAIGISSLIVYLLPKIKKSDKTRA